jgi:hypothetical protein
MSAQRRPFVACLCLLVLLVLDANAQVDGTPWHYLRAARPICAVDPAADPDVFCSGGIGPCTDEQAECTMWASRGECIGEAGGWMTVRCRRSCSLCAPTSVAAEPLLLAASSLPIPTPPSALPVFAPTPTDPTSKTPPSPPGTPQRRAATPAYLLKCRESEWQGVRTTHAHSVSLFDGRTAAQSERCPCASGPSLAPWLSDGRCCSAFACVTTCAARVSPRV